MPHINSTTLDEQFEHRFSPIERTLQVWGVRAYSGKGDLAPRQGVTASADRAVAALQRRPGHLVSSLRKSLGHTYAKKMYGHTILHEKIVERYTDYAEDMVRKEGSDLTGEEALANKFRQQHGPSRYSREILLADDRIDLERAIRRGFAMLPERYHADMRQVMTDIMEGYNQREIEDKHGWTNNHTRVLFRFLRTTFYEALTGHMREVSAYVGSKAPASEDDLRQLRELRAQGLSFVKIAARMDYSPAWVMQNLQRSHDRCLPQSTEERQQKRADRIAAIQNLLAQGMSYREVARTMGTSYNTIRRLLGKC